MKKCEDRQKAILKFMKKTVQTKGFPPTVREICTALGIKSTSTVYSDIKALEAAGLVKKDPSKPRALMIVDKDKGRKNAGSDTSIQSSRKGTNNQRTSSTVPSQQISGQEVVELPVIGRVAAGTPILAEQNIEDSFPVPSRFIGRGNNFMLVVHGNSMINAGINDGDYIIVNEDPSPANGEIVVAMIAGEYDQETTVKTFYRENGHIRLQPENDTMDPIIIDSSKEIHIVGKVKGVFRYINEYMQQMKDKGVYDNSTVIITADHGGYGLYERPAVFVKLADTHNDVMQVNSDSVTFKNLYATYGKAALGQKSNYGNTLFDMVGVSQVRYHVAPWDVSKGMYPADEYLKNRDYSVFKIEGDADNPQISVIKDEQQMKNINN